MGSHERLRRLEKDLQSSILLVILFFFFLVGRGVDLFSSLRSAKKKKKWQPLSLRVEQTTNPFILITEGSNKKIVPTMKKKN